MTKSFEHWCWEHHRDIFALLMFGHLELLTEEMWNDYIEWCKTDEAKPYLDGAESEADNAESD